MKEAIIFSACECQARLEAVLDQDRRVREGWAVDADGCREKAPAHAIGAERPRFDVAWLCPYCGRNTLRSFADDGLAWRDAPPGAPS